jgi:DNA polymerase I-like protein with 3'-5' exonuclease and polymerase domains
VRQYSVITNEAELRNLRLQLEEAPLIAIDTETTGLDIYQPHFRLVGVSLAPSAYQGYYLPLDHLNFAGLSYQPPMLSQEAVTELMSWVFAHKPTVMHNRSYDRNVLAVTLGLDHSLTQTSQDTKLAAHLQDENAPKSLKELAKRWLGVRDGGGRFADIANTATQSWETLWTSEKVGALNKHGRTYKKNRFVLQPDWLTKAEALYRQTAGEASSLAFLFDYVSHLFARMKSRTLVEYSGGMPQDFRYLPVNLAAHYAADDAMNTYALWVTLYNGLSLEGLTPLYQNLELQVDDIMTRAEHRGILLHPETLLEAKALLEERSIQAREEAMTALSQALDPRDFMEGKLNPHTLLNSPKQLAYLLYEVLGYPILERTETHQPSTSRSALQGLLSRRSKPRLRPDLEEQGAQFLQTKHKLDAMKKLASTYTDSLIEKADPQCRVHPSFNITGTVSGRMSSNNPNFQNIPRLSSEETANSPWLHDIDIRKAFVADPGYVLVDADFVSMEMVVCAALSRDDNMTRLLNEGRDLHCHTARYAFKVGFDLDDATFKKKYKDYRQKAKVVNFAMIYGGTSWTLQKNFGFTEEEAEAAVQGYFEGFPGVKVWMDQVYQELSQKGYVVYPEYGYIKRMDTQPPTNKWDKDAARQYRAALRSCQNALIQGYSAFIVKDAIVQLNKAFLEQTLESRVAFQVHDEIGVLAPYREAEQVGTLMSSIMTKWLGKVLLTSEVEYKRTMSKNEPSLTLEELRALARSYE